MLRSCYSCSHPLTIFASSMDVMMHGTPKRFLFCDAACFWQFARFFHCGSKTVHDTIVTEVAIMPACSAGCKRVIERALETLERSYALGEK